MSRASSPPVILLTGRDGQVGWELRRALAPLGPVVAPPRAELDLRDLGAVRALVRATAPQVVVNAAAYTAVDLAEREPETAMRINGEAPGVIAEEAARLGALMIHFSTDFVFDGAQGSPYTESDPPRPLSVYGHSKLAGERAIRAATPNAVILRLAWVYSLRRRNFLLAIRERARQAGPLRVVTDQVGSPTWARWIASATAVMLSRLLAVPEPDFGRGLYHLCAAGAASRFDFAQAIVDRLPPDERRCPALERASTKDFPAPAARPANSVLNCEKLRRELGVTLPPWQEGLAQALEECA